MSTSSTVRDILKSKPVSQVWRVGPQQSVYDALELMAEKNVGSVLVIEGERIIGILSERDYARKVALKNRRSRDTAVADVMTAPVLFVTPKENVEACMALMTEQRVRHLPVLENGQLVGIISIGDIVKAAINDREFLIDQLIQYITGSKPQEPEFQAEPAPLRVAQ